MNKKFTRLTALLLALLLMMSTPAIALADSIPTVDQYSAGLKKMQDDLSLIPVTLETPKVENITVDATALVPTYTTEEGVVTPARSISVTANTAPDATDGYQWMINVGGVWANVDGATQQTLNLTYAMAKPAMDENGEVQLRCRIFPADAGEDAVYEDDISVAVNDAVEYTKQTGKMNIEVTQYTQNEEPDAVYDAAWAFQSAARTPAVSTFAVARAGETPELGKYSVVINYVFENNEIAADPYTANLSAGSDFSVTVKHPSVLGYLPYIGEDEETSTEIELKITDIQADLTYTVTYKPTNVDYKVIHYQQNLDNDKYTIVETETKQGLTKSTVPEVAKDYEGFYALLYEKPEIAADGSTVVEIYYERNYYLMIFNLGEGGYGVEPIYARYGAPVEIGKPTRPGYTFNGWSPAVPSTVPVDGGRYTAQWIANETAKVKVVIWGENPNDEEYSYLTTGELMLPSNTEYTYNGTDQLYLYCDKEEHTHDASCIICGKEEHTQHTEECLGECIHTAHTLACYSAGDHELVETTKPDQLSSDSRDGIHTYTTTDYGFPITHYYLHLDEKWYCSENSNYGPYYRDTQEITLNCTHTHTDACYTCEAHAHTADCYGCGKEAHTHDNNCTGTVAGLDSKLWKFVKSDTVTVNPDGSSVINVYYDRTSFTLTFHYNYKNGTYDSTSTITDKWGADIGSRFLAVNTAAKGNLWSIETDGKSPWTSYLQIMPQYDEDYYCRNSSTTEQTAEYYTENADGTYSLEYAVTAYYGNNLTISKEDFYEMEGFTYSHGTDGDGGSMPSPGRYGDFDGAKFYYKRHRYAIEFYSPTVLLKKTENVPYESALNSYNWTPDASMAPDKYEPGSVEFEGWYLNPECTGDKFDFTTHTMPAGTKDGDTTLTLYAKWVPVTRTVEFYLDKTAMENGVKLCEDQTTPHGSLLKNPVAAPENGGYTFVGWFYMDGDEEKAFLFPTMVITKDMKVYGKWSSNVLKEYIVYFKIQGTDTEIADPIKGSTLAGNSKTFDAKGGIELYPNYQDGYFPLVKSHTMTLDINTPDMDEDQTEYADEKGNTWTRVTNADGTTKIVQSFTFWYVQKDAVPYTVYYVAETLKDGEDASKYETITRDGKTYYIIADTYTDSENRKAVVTENFEPVPGYMPDAYQKRLVVDGTDGAVNEIIFYYSVDSTHAYYKITHYTQNTDGVNWTEYASSQAVGDIGKTYTADPLTIDGFTYDSSVVGTVVSGELTANGLELKLYYVRNEYPYEVRYLEQGTGKQLADPKTGTDKYGQVISESAIGIANYTAVDPTSQTLTIKIEESQTEAKLNIITFYYVENEVTINYVVVGPEGCGTVSPEVETVKVLSGTAQGSTATANGTAYKFVGWYEDAACTNELSTDAKYVPTKAEGTAWKDGTTYYAKFDWNISTLTITKEGMAAGESAIFTVEAVMEDGEKVFTVTVPNNGSVKIHGVIINSEYTVSEKGDWTWRYTSKSENASGTIATNGSTVEFENKPSNNKWLDDEYGVHNEFNQNGKGTKIE